MMEHCKTCGNYFQGCFTPICKDCRYYPERQQNPMTNGDKIRAMTDEELAYNFEYSTICGRIQNSNPEWCGTTGECRNCVLRWLKQPAEGENEK